jgi:hypothetical protein
MCLGESAVTALKGGELRTDPCFYANKEPERRMLEPSWAIKERNHRDPLDSI